MGLSGPVAAVILVGALMGQAGNLYVANRNADVKIEEAREVWQRRHEAMLKDGVDILSTSWNSGLNQLTLTVNNTGEVQLNSSRLTVVLDGVDKTDLILTRTISGESTKVWNPWKSLVVVVQLTSNPTDAIVIDEHGKSDVWRGI
jgi:archaellum component FlaF (FlaF/FlaG flagellin family)